MKHITVADLAFSYVFIRDVAEKNSRIVKINALVYLKTDMDEKGVPKRKHRAIAELNYTDELIDDALLHCKDVEEFYTALDRQFLGTMRRFIEMDLKEMYGIGIFRGIQPAAELVTMRQQLEAE